MYIEHWLKKGKFGKPRLKGGALRRRWLWWARGESWGTDPDDDDNCFLFISSLRAH